MTTPLENSCLTNNELGAYIERRLQGGARDRARTHIETCDDCGEAYFVAVQLCAQQQRGYDTSPEAWVRDAEDVAIASGGRLGVRADMRRFRPRSWPRLVPAALAIAVVLVAGVMLWPTPRTGSPEDLSPLIEPIAKTVTDASSRRAVVLPGADLASMATGAVLRSGVVSRDTNFDRSMSAMVDRYRRGRLPSRDVLWIIAGYLATGQYETARKFIDDSRLHVQDDPDYAVLEAVLAYSESELDRARDLLEAVLVHESRHSIARLNLANILLQLDQQDQARFHLRTLVDRAEEEPIRLRATNLLSTIDS